MRGFDLTSCFSSRAERSLSFLSSLSISLSHCHWWWQLNPWCIRACWCENDNEIPDWWFNGCIWVHVTNERCICLMSNHDNTTRPIETRWSWHQFGLKLPKVYNKLRSWNQDDCSKVDQIAWHRYCTCLHQMNTTSSVSSYWTKATVVICLTTTIIF